MGTFGMAQIDPNTISQVFLTFYHFRHEYKYHITFGVNFGYDNRIVRVDCLRGGMVISFT